MTILDRVSLRLGNFDFPSRARQPSFLPMEDGRTSPGLRRYPTEQFFLFFLGYPEHGDRLSTPET